MAVKKKTKGLGAQAVFNRAVRQFAKQPTPCKDGGGCFYRGSNGLKCIIGSFIPDDRYDSSMEAKNFEYLMREHPKLRKYFMNQFPGLFEGPSTHNPLGVALQDVHDDCPTTEAGTFKKVAIRARLRQIAKEYGLKDDQIRKSL